MGESDGGVEVRARCERRGVRSRRRRSRVLRAQRPTSWRRTCWAANGSCPRFRWTSSSPRAWAASTSAKTASRTRRWCCIAPSRARRSVSSRVLIEHFAGAFPVWLSPVQAVVIPIADRHEEYAQKVLAELKANGIRCGDRRIERAHAGQDSPRAIAEDSVHAGRRRQRSRGGRGRDPLAIGRRPEGQAAGGVHRAGKSRRSRRRRKPYRAVCLTVDETN